MSSDDYYFTDNSAVVSAVQSLEHSVKVGVVVIASHLFRVGVVMDNPNIDVNFLQKLGDSYGVGAWKLAEAAVEEHEKEQRRNDSIRSQGVAQTDATHAGIDGLH